MSSGQAACAQKKGDFRFVSREASHVSSEVDSNSVCRKLAALLIRISSRPNSFAVSSKSRLISESLLRSAATATPRRPNFSISATALRASALEERWWTTTSAPSFASRKATARPSRLADPVTSATRPFSGTSLFADGGMIEDDTIAHKAAKISRALHRLAPHVMQTIESPRDARDGGGMNLDLLAIAAHPDDVELTCGGTLLKMAQRGYKTGILDLTAGEIGTRCTPETRAKEAAKAAKLLGVRWRGTLGVPDSDGQPTRQHKLRLAAVIRDLRPKTVILPYWEARHPDHYHASALGYEGCFLAGLKQLPLEGEAYRPFKILYSIAYANVRPTFVVDITAQYEQRRKAILAFRSQFRPKKGEPKSKVHLAIDRLEAEMNQLARHYGQMIGVDYGEPFLQKELMKVDDIVKIDVRSI